MKRWTALLALGAIAFASCASRSGDVGTSTSAAKPWTPPAGAIPEPRANETAASLPPNFTPGMKVTLTDIVDIALSMNPQTRVAWLRARAAQAGLAAANSNFLPEVDLGASALTTRTPKSDGGATTQTTYGPTATLNYLLFDFGGREAQAGQAREALIAANFLHNQAIQDVILATEQAYYGYLNAKALLTAQEATVREQQTALDAADARHRAGVATIADVLQAKTALSQAELIRETIEGNLRTIEGALATAMGVPTTTHFDLGELPLDVPSAKIADDVDTLIRQAVASRPELAAARATAESARLRVNEVRAGGLPSVSLSSSVGQTFFGTSSTGTPYSAGLFLRWPVFTGFRTENEVRQAQLLAEAANEDVRSVEQRVNLQVWTSYFALQTAARRLTTARDLLASATQSADVARSRYQAGVGSILDLLTAESALENARAQEVQSRTDWFTALAQLAHDTGSLR